jgi:hypothetical protein
MSMAEHFTPDLQALASAAVDKGVEAATRGKGDFSPFALIDASHEGVLTVAAAGDLADLPLDEQLDGLREMVRAVAKRPDAVVRSAAIVYDTFLTLDEERSDAVMVEAHEGGQPAGVLVGMRYTPKRGLRKGRSDGEPIVLRDDLDPMF